MNLRLIYWGMFWVILAIVVYGVSYFSSKLFFPLPAMPETQLAEPLIDSVPLQPPLVPPFDEREIMPASEIWLRWENLKNETDRMIE